MFCRYCGRELPADALFCNHCGRKIQFSHAEAREQSVMGGAIPSLDASLSPLPLVAATTQILPQSQPLNTPTTPQSLSPGAMQRFLLRVFQPALANSAFFGVVVGGISAIILGILACWIFLTLVHVVIVQSVANDENTADYVIGIISLHTPLRDSLQLFLVIHGATIHTQNGFGQNALLSSFTTPLNGLLVLPALFLTFGGYIAASTDFQNRVQHSLLRGAAIAIPYTILLFIMVSQVNGSTPATPGASATDTGTLTIDTTTLLAFGAFWSILFGLLGASLKLARGQWRHMMRQYLRTTPHPQITGMIMGGLSAAGLGIALSLLFIFGLLAYTTYSIPFLQNTLCSSVDWRMLILWGITQGPIHAVNAFFFSFEAPITILNQSQHVACFYTPGARTILTLRDGSFHFPLWIYALQLIPGISLFLGGRTSAAIARVQGLGPAAVQGALIALPFGLLMILLTVIATIAYTFTYGSAASASISSTTTIVQSVSVGPIDVLLWALLSGAVLGALGGMYQASPAKRWGNRILSGLASALLLIGTPLFLILDHLSHQPRSSRRSHPRSLLYAALLCTLLLAIVAGVAGGMLIAYNQTLLLRDNQLAKDIITVLLITLPGLLLLSACISVLCRDPVTESQSNSSFNQPC